MEQGVLTPQSLDDLKASILAETNDATDRAEAVAYPRPEDLFSRLYEGPWEPWQ